MEIPGADATDRLDGKDEHGLAWQLYQAAGEQLPFADNSFDLVTSYAMFHELPLHASLANLREYLRVLKPGGYAVVGDVKAYHAYNNYERWKNDYWNQVHGGDPFWREYASTDLAGIATEAGFAEADKLPRRAEDEDLSSVASVFVIAVLV